MFKKNNIQRYISVFLIFVIAAACFLSILKDESISLYSLFGGSLFVVLIYMLLNVILDGFVIFRFKLNIIMGGLWIMLLFYLYIRLRIYGIYNISAVYFISFLASLMIMLLPFTVKACDDTGFISIKKYDHIWIIMFLLFMLLFLIRTYYMTLDTTNFNDGIETILGNL